MLHFRVSYTLASKNFTQLVVCKRKLLQVMRGLNEIHDAKQHPGLTDFSPKKNLGFSLASGESSEESTNSDFLRFARR